MGGEAEESPGLIQAFLKSVLQEKCGHVDAGVPASVTVERLETVWICFEDLGWTTAPAISVTAADGTVLSTVAAPFASAWQWRFVPGFGDPVVDGVGQYSFSIAGPDGGPTTAPYSGTIRVEPATQARIVMAATDLGPGETLHVALAGYSPGSLVPHVYGPGTPRDPVTGLSDYPRFADADSITIGADGEGAFDWTPTEQTLAGEYGFWLDPLPVNCRSLCGFVLR